VGSAGDVPASTDVAIARPAANRRNLGRVGLVGFIGFVASLQDSSQLGNAVGALQGSLRMSRLRVSARLGSLAVAIVLAAAACSSPPEASVDPGPRPDLAVVEASAAPFLPPVTVWDVGEKEWVQLANFLPADKPVLVWFWAPH